jgi:hypothetical protein
MAADGCVGSSAFKQLAHVLWPQALDLLSAELVPSHRQSVTCPFSCSCCCVCSEGISSTAHQFAHLPSCTLQCSHAVALCWSSTTPVEWHLRSCQPASQPELLTAGALTCALSFGIYTTCPNSLISLNWNLSISKFRETLKIRRTHANNGRCQHYGLSLCMSELGGLHPTSYPCTL